MKSRISSWCKKEFTVKGDFFEAITFGKLDTKCNHLNGSWCAFLKTIAEKVCGFAQLGGYQPTPLGISIFFFFGYS